MQFLADECVESQVVGALRNEGHSVLYMIEIERSISDEEVILRANAENAILITGDKDFGELIFRQGLISFGIILLRLHRIEKHQKAIIVTNAIRDHLNELEHCFTVISPNSIRIRKLFD